MELVVRKYEELLQPSVTKTKVTQIKLGLAYGMSQVTQFCGFAALFWAAGKIINDHLDENGQPTISVERVFIAIFAIMFGA